MAGLAAVLNAPGSIDAIAVALASRGADGALCQLDGRGGTQLEVAVRAVMPAIPRVADDHEHTVAAFAVDGVASITALDAGYTARGPAGLTAGDDEPYAVILADAERGELVLARNGDGPGLYYARHGDGWLVASEPLALVSAGVAARPDVDVIRRFIETGLCDDTDRTFFERIRRVLPGEAVVLTADGAATSSGSSWQRGTPSVSTALRSALRAAGADARVGVLLGPGLAGAALLGTALSPSDGSNRPRPVAVYTATFPSLREPASQTPAVLAATPYGTIRHVPYAFEPSELDLDGFLRDLGEPVPDLDLYLLWAIAKGRSGEVDTLVDTALGESACVARVCDRISARYGVVVRSPLREVGPVELIGNELESIVGQTLLPGVARYAGMDSAQAVTAGEIVLWLRDTVAAALAVPRPWHDRTGGIDPLRRLAAGEATDEESLLRAYLVECWLRAVGDPGSTDASPSEDLPEPDLGTDDLEVAGVTWARLPVRTEAFAPGAELVAKAAWYVADALTEQFAVSLLRETLRGPWFATLAGKVVAVSQRRVCPLWDIKPDLAARVLARIARRWLPRLGEAWTMQVAIDHGGLPRVAAGTLAAALSMEWSQRLLPQAAATLYPPRAGAVAPADGAVVRGPFSPDDVADALLDALHYSLAPHLVDTLAGCAVISADEMGSRLLGFAPGPYVHAVPHPEPIVAEIFADNPAGQGGECTPIVLVCPAPQPRTAGPRQRGTDFAALDTTTKSGQSVSRERGVTTRPA